MELTSNTAFSLFLLCGFFIILVMFVFIWRSIASLALSLKDEKRLFLSNLAEIEEKIQSIKIQVNSLDLNSGLHEKSANLSYIQGVKNNVIQNTKVEQERLNLEATDSYEPITASVRTNTTKNREPKPLNKNTDFNLSVSGSDVVNDVFLALNNPIPSFDKKVPIKEQSRIMILKD